VCAGRSARMKCVCCVPIVLKPAAKLQMAIHKNRVWQHQNHHNPETLIGSVLVDSVSVPCRQRTYRQCNNPVNEKRTGLQPRCWPVLVLAFVVMQCSPIMLLVSDS
jgi:hypothetical protein